MTHLDICNTSYGKKKSGIDPTPVRAGDVQHIVGKTLKES
jgi:hypothetical protein